MEVGTSVKVTNVINHANFGGCRLRGWFLRRVEYRLFPQEADMALTTLPCATALVCEVIRCTMDEILKLCSAPTPSNGLSAAAEAMVDKYSQLKDVINGTIVGPGWVSVRNQLEYRLCYFKRPLNTLRRVTATGRRLNTGR
jgi:hypothetical protein